MPYSEKQTTTLEGRLLEVAGEVAYLETQYHEIVRDDNQLAARLSDCRTGLIAASQRVAQYATEKFRKGQDDQRERDDKR